VQAESAEVTASKPGVGSANDLDESFAFDFANLDATVHPIFPKLYLIDASTGRLLILNSVSGITENAIDLALAPKQPELSQDGAFLYIALAATDYRPYYWAEDEIGEIAVLDTRSELIIDHFPLNFSPSTVKDIGNGQLVIGNDSNKMSEIVILNLHSGVTETVCGSLCKNF